MTKEKNQVVSEVKEVVSSIRMKVQQEKLITLKDVDSLSSSMEKLITDYNAALDNYLVMNSLVLKHEKFLELIGLVNYGSASDTKILDEAINVLNKVSDSMKQR